MRLFDYYLVERELKSNMRRSSDELCHIQSKKIQNIIKHAYETVPYYRELFNKCSLKPNDIKTNSDLNKIPVSTKQDIIDAGDAIISTRYDKTNLTRRTTGGSTGKSLVFYHSTKDSTYAGVSYDRARWENGFSQLKNRIVMIGAFREESRYKVTIRDRIEMAFLRRRRPHFIDMSLCQEKIEDVLGQSVFDSLKGYPSFLYLLARNIENGKFSVPSLKYIFTASETLDDTTRKFINRIFGVDVRDIYGCWEGGCIAWECDAHEGYHANIDLVALQVLNETGQTSDYGKGNLILTNLNSHAVPFIRYQTNDICELAPNFCSCGRPLPLIKSILGRLDDFVVLPDGRRLSPPGLLVVLHDCSSNILEFQIVQEKISELDVRIVLIDKSIAEHTMKELKCSLIRHIGCSDLNISIRAVEKIEKTVSGKHKSIISRAQ